MSTKTVVELDLVGYSDVCRTLEENLDTEVVARFNEQIQQFVDVGLTTVEAERERVVLATTGDGAIVAFDNPSDAHAFATAVLKATEAHNAKRTVASSQRWFRVGLATGDLYQQPRDGGGQVIAGTVIANAVRLEAAARPGQLVADAATFASLPTDVQALYGPEEMVPGKREERFAARRCTIVAYTAAQDSPPTIQSILDLFDRLNPRDQLDRVMLLIGMPPRHRPPDTLELFRRQDKIVDWSANGGDKSLTKLDAALKDLIRKQQPPRQ
jgi:class 3 adenylate cyclase